MKKWIAAVGCGALLLFSGCRSMETYRAEREEKAVRAMTEILARRLPPGTVMSLPECIATALRNNLDLEVTRLEERITREKRNAEVLGMLPELMVTNDWSIRSNRPASASQSVSQGGATFNYSQSSEKYDNLLKLELAFSVIDFGLAYFNSSQAQDRHLMSLQQLRRTEQNLTLEVARAYFRVAAAQLAVETTQQLLDKCSEIEQTIAELGRTRQVSPLRLFDEHRRFLQIHQRLLAFQRNYEDGRVELLTLLGLPPADDLRLDTRALEKLPELELPPIEELEQVALLERPELYSLDMQTNLVLTEARKTLLLMLPNVRIFADFTNSSNMFLYHSSWLELGVRAAFNLLRLPQQIAHYRALDSEHHQLEVRQLALAVGVLSQVRIARARLDEVRRRFLLDDQNLRIFEEHLKSAESGFQSGGMLSQLELDRLRVETAESRIQRTVSLGEYLSCYYQLMNSVGVDTLDPAVIDRLAARFRERGQTGEE